VLFVAQIKKQERRHVPVIYPVILAVPEDKQRLQGREKVAFLSDYARRALAASAEKSGMAPLGRLEKDERGAPLPLDGIYWSLTHKSAWVGGVVAPDPVGLDLETIRPVHPGLPERIASEKEIALAHGMEQDQGHVFFRYWTAKEAVLKAAGDGIRGLDRCRITALPDPVLTRVQYEGREWTVAHHFFPGQVAAVTTSNDRQVRWTVLN
jgi:4'-phosphopantetheinyl transferase